MKDIKSLISIILSIATLIITLGSWLMGAYNFGSSIGKTNEKLDSIALTVTEVSKELKSVSSTLIETKTRVDGHSNDIKRLEARR